MLCLVLLRGEKTDLERGRIVAIKSQNLRACLDNCEGHVKGALDRLPSYILDQIVVFMDRDHERGRQIDQSCPIVGLLVGRFKIAVAFKILNQVDPEIILFVRTPPELEGSVKILAETEDHRYGAIIEYRRTAGGWKRSLPTGKMTFAMGETSADTAIVSAFAEILQEAGCIGGVDSEAKIIGQTDWESELVHGASVVTVLVRGLDCSAAGTPDLDEEIVPELLSLSGLYAFATTEFNPAFPEEPALARDPSLMAIAAILASLSKFQEEDPGALRRELQLISEMLDGTQSFSSDGEPISGDPDDDEHPRTPWFNSEDPNHS